MLTPKALPVRILLASFAMLIFVACEKSTEKSPTGADESVEDQNLAKTSLPASLSSTPDIFVNTTSDAADFGGSQQVADLPGPDGVVSLREAIIAANNTAGPQMIGFNIPTSDAGFDGTVFTIQPKDNPLPSLDDNGTTIDGATQTAFTENTNAPGPEIVIDGSFVVDGPGPEDGINISASNCHVHSLVINSFSTGDGIRIGTSGTSGNRVTGCFLGTDHTGTIAKGNQLGADIGGGPFNNIIGGIGPGEGNLISGNFHTGVNICCESSSNVVQGNLIGTDRTGTFAIGNEIFGVRIDASNNLIGGTTPEARNIISGNNLGINFNPDNPEDPPSGVNLIQGNFIGTNATGTAPLGNTDAGIRIEAGTSKNVIGGVSVGSRNLIAFNYVGIVLGALYRGTTTSSRNSIFLNSGLGIDLSDDGVTLNDPGDTDTGPNNLMNFPVLTSAKTTHGQLIVKGSIDTPNPKTVTIEFFANPAPIPGGDPSGYGEGAIFLGTKKPNSQGNFTATLPPVPVGTLITATATDAEGNTSEFAANIEATR